MIVECCTLSFVLSCSLDAGEFAANAFRNARSLAFGEESGADADLSNKVELGEMPLRCKFYMFQK